jgi:hypothetical protein
MLKNIKEQIAQNTYIYTLFAQVSFLVNKKHPNKKRLIVPLLKHFNVKNACNINIIMLDLTMICVDIAF